MANHSVVIVHYDTNEDDVSIVPLEDIDRIAKPRSTDGTAKKTPKKQYNLF